MKHACLGVAAREEALRLPAEHHGARLGQVALPQGAVAFEGHLYIYIYIYIYICFLCLAFEGHLGAEASCREARVGFRSCP